MWRASRRRVGAPRTGDVQITRPWQGPRATGRVNVKGPTGRLASRWLDGVTVDVIAEPSWHVCALPFEFLSQCLAGEGLARVAHYLSAVACHVSDCHGLAAGTCDGGGGRGRCFASRSVAPERELPHRTNAQSPCCELPCTIEGVAESRVFGVVSFEHGQQSLDACDCPADQLLAVFLRQGQISHVRFHAAIVAGGHPITIAYSARRSLSSKTRHVTFTGKRHGFFSAMWRDRSGAWGRPYSQGERLPEHSGSTHSVDEPALVIGPADSRKTRPPYCPVKVPRTVRSGTVTTC
jgi:hypothetical protein